MYGNGETLTDRCSPLDDRISQISMVNGTTAGDVVSATASLRPDVKSQQSVIEHLFCFPAR